MTDETQGASPTEDAPLLPVEQAADSSPAPEAQAPQVVETPADDAAPRDEEGKFVSPKAQKRIDQLTWESNQRAREAEYWRQQAMLHTKPEEPKPVEAKPLKLEDFSYDEAAFYKAVADQTGAIARQEALAALKQEREAEREAAREKTFQERLTKLARNDPSLASVMSDPSLPVSKTMAEVIKDSETGPELLVWIASNREAAAQIYDLPPHMAAREMGRIEARLEAERTAKTRPAPVVTQAPPPPPKVEAIEASVGAVKASEPESDTLSIEDWVKRRNKEVNRKR